MAVAQGKPVWITETGWPVSGPTEAQAVASAANARAFWEAVGCNTLFDKINTWWFQLDDYPTTPIPAFGVVGTAISTTPLYDLSCPSNTYVTSSLRFQTFNFCDQFCRKKVTFHL